jgi:hypothetical protein
MNRIMNQALGSISRKPVEQRITVGLIDTLLRDEFIMKGIYGTYEFGVFNPGRNKSYWKKPAAIMIFCFKRVIPSLCCPEWNSSNRLSACVFSR